MKTVGSRREGHVKDRSQHLHTVQREIPVRILHFLASIGANRRGRVPRPSWCTYLVTLRCNARCQMCDSWRLTPSAELSPAEVAQIFGALGRLDVVRLSGGEPFLRHDFAPLARAIDEASRPLVLHVTTNGSFPDAVEAFASSFPRPRALHFLVSFDGLAHVHDHNRGACVSFARAEETVRRLVKLRQRRGIRVTVQHTVISQASLDDARGLQQHFGTLGVEVVTVLAYASSATYSLGAQRRDPSPSYPEPGFPLHPKLEGCDVFTLVRGELQRTRRVRDPLLAIGKSYYLRGLLSRLQRDSPPWPRPRCVALRSHLRILPDGRVPVCQFNGQVVGDLRSSTPEAVWRSPLATAAREWVDRCPGCWAECEVIPNAIYTADILQGVAAARNFAGSSHRRHNIVSEGGAS